MRGFTVAQCKDLFFSTFRVDDGGMVADQRGVFRVNCMDCLDRTNVVQATIARAVLENLVNRSLKRFIFEISICCQRRTFAEFRLVQIHGNALHVTASLKI